MATFGITSRLDPLKHINLGSGAATNRHLLQVWMFIAAAVPRLQNHYAGLQRPAVTAEYFNANRNADLTSARAACCLPALTTYTVTVPSKLRTEEVLAAWAPAAGALPANGVVAWERRLSANLSSYVFLGHCGDQRAVGKFWSSTTYRYPLAHHLALAEAGVAPRIRGYFEV